MASLDDRCFAASKHQRTESKIWQNFSKEWTLTNGRYPPIRVKLIQPSLTLFEGKESVLKLWFDPCPNSSDFRITHPETDLFRTQTQVTPHNNIFGMGFFFIFNPWSFRTILNELEKPRREIRELFVSSDIHMNEYWVSREMGGRQGVKESFPDVCAWLYTDGRKGGGGSTALAMTREGVLALGSLESEYLMLWNKSIERLESRPSGACHVL